MYIATTILKATIIACIMTFMIIYNNCVTIMTFIYNNSETIMTFIYMMFDSDYN